MHARRRRGHPWTYDHEAFSSSGSLAMLIAAAALGRISTPRPAGLATHRWRPTITCTVKSPRCFGPTVKYRHQGWTLTLGDKDREAGSSVFWPRSARDGSDRPQCRTTNCRDPTNSYRFQTSIMPRSVVLQMPGLIWNSKLISSSGTCNESLKPWALAPQVQGLRSRLRGPWPSFCGLERRRLATPKCKRLRGKVDGAFSW
jgi:hypothetical protein